MSTLQDKMRNNVYVSSGPGIFEDVFPHTARPGEGRDDFIIKQDAPKSLFNSNSNGALLIMNTNHIIDVKIKVLYHCFMRFEI